MQPFKIARQIAEKEYEKFRIIQDREYTSDFDKIVGEITLREEAPPTRDDGLEHDQLAQSDH